MNVAKRISEAGEPLRVMHVLPTLTGGGAENFVASLVPRLHGDGMVSSVMTIYPSERPKGDLLDDSQIFPIERRGRYDAAFFPRMVAAMRAWHPHVVHTHMHNGKYWGRLAAIAAGVPLIVHTVHNPCDTERSPVEPFADRMLNAASSAIVTFSEQQRHFLAQLERIPEEKVVVIPNGIVHRPIPSPEMRQRARHQLGIAEETYAVFVVGRLGDPKNQQLAIEAMAGLSPETRGRIHLYLVGAGVDGSRLARLIEERGVERNVTLLGHRPDVAEILPAADLVFMPSLTEGMPLALLEAMGAGVPVLSTPWTGARDLLRDEQLGTLAPDWSPASIARCFAKLCDDTAHQHVIANAAQKYARCEYDIDTTAQRHRELYRMLAARKKAA